MSTGTKVDWPEILDRLGVEYVSTGPKTTRGHVNVACPYCDEDPGHHMGLSLRTGRYYCWRDVRHRGGDPSAVLAKIADIPYDRAKSEIGVAGVSPGESISDLRKRHASLLNAHEEIKQYDEVEWPAMSFVPSPKRGRAFYNYLKKRGIKLPPSAWADYNMRALTVGRFRHRVLFPAYSRDARQIGWTGRAIGSDSMRYLSHPGGRALASAVFAHPVALTMPDRVLVVCEGPMDALKVDWFGRAHGVRAVALFSLMLRHEQLDVLIETMDRYQKIIVLLDRDAHSASERVRSALSCFSPTVVRLPEGVKDPGELSKAQVEKMCQGWVACR